jgi:hypothetical protein
VKQPVDFGQLSMISTVNPKDFGGQFANLWQFPLHIGMGVLMI